MPDDPRRGPAPDAPGRLEDGAVPARDAALDVVGLYCPVPIIRTAERVRRMRPGEVLEIVADDPVALVDMPHWCASSGHRFRGWTGGAAGELRFFVEVTRGRLPRGGKAHGP